jgi:hypothetical protein
MMASGREESTMKRVQGLGWMSMLLLLGGCAETPDAEPQLRLQVAALRAELQQAREQARGNMLACTDLSQEHDKVLASARQLRADTQYLRASTTKLSDAVTRLNYEDWNKVVPEVQLDFGDVESASRDLDARVGRVLIALRADAGQP